MNILYQPDMLPSTVDYFLVYLYAYLRLYAFWMNVTDLKVVGNAHFTVYPGFSREV
ncbi:MAG: hypothetical protein RID53_14635 [Coleofasciculus sp. B1-GNL1-01]|uniref:hypothetical protein n=1 Tax=Coleofasciculus sp. B1-GNL1-01 TaxID=3068484 RepID=UPI0032FC7763